MQSKTSIEEEINSILPEQKDQDKLKKTNWFSRLINKIMNGRLKKYSLRRKRSISLDNISELKTLPCSSSWLDALEAAIIADENKQSREAELKLNKLKDLVAELEEERWLTYKDYCMI